MRPSAAFRSIAFAAIGQISCLYGTTQARRTSVWWLPQARRPARPRAAQTTASFPRICARTWDALSSVEISVICVIYGEVSHSGKLHSCQFPAEAGLTHVLEHLAHLR